MDINSNIKTLLELLKLKGHVPAKIEKTIYKSLFFYNCYDNKRSEIISDGVTTGVSDIESVALLKAIVEWIERLGFTEGFNNNIDACSTQHSGGFAAYPHFNLEDKEYAKFRARENAIDEALERYCWATWWDNKTNAEIDFNFIFTSDRCLILTELIKQYTPYSNIILISPVTANYESKKTFIFFAKLNDCGFISGGATGNISDCENTIFRALSELVRHSIGLKRAITKNLIEKNLYEKRLIFFGLGLGDSFVYDRLDNSFSKNDIKLPELKYDTEIEHKFSKNILIHRCLFENQPPFIGGALERLCI